MTPMDKAIYWVSYIFREICDIVLPYQVMRKWPRPRERVLRITVAELQRQLAGELVGECTDIEFEVHGHFKKRPVRLRFALGFDHCIVELNARRKPGSVRWKLSHDKKSKQKRRDEWTRDASPQNTAHVSDDISVSGDGGEASPMQTFERLPENVREATVAMLDSVGGHIEYDDGTVQIWPRDEYIYDFEAARRIGDDLELAWHIADAFDRMLGYGR